MRRDKLYTINKGNRYLLFNDRIDDLEKSEAADEAEAPLDYNSKSDTSSRPKKDKLHTVTKWNKPAFAKGVDRVNNNIFDGFSGSTLERFDRAASSYYGASYGDEGSTLSDYMGSKNAFGITKAQNPFSKMNVGSTLTAAAPIVGGAVGGLLSNGMSTGVGNVMSGLGKAASAIPGPYGAAIGAGLQIVGGAVNGLFGEKVNQQKLSQNVAGTSYLSNFKSNAGYFDDVTGPQTQLAVQDAYKGGIFNKSAKRKNAAARADRLIAQNNALAQVQNNVSNIANAQMDTMLANYSAFGGPLDLTLKHDRRRRK